MIFFVKYGLLPEFTVMYICWYYQLKAAMELVSLRRLTMKERRQFLALSPGEQYRLHLREGGYRP